MVKAVSTKRVLWVKLSCPFYRVQFISRMGQGLGQAQNPEVGAEPFEAENKRKVLKSCDFRTFMVAETGLEPATSGL